MPVDLSTLARPPAPPDTPAETAQRSCPHANLQPSVDVQRLQDEDHPGDTVGMLVIARLQCLECGMFFKWLGVPVGQSFARPMMSEDQTALLAPVVPAHANTYTGAALPELRGLSDDARNAVTAEILAALINPSGFTPQMLAETRTEHRARAIFAALERIS